MFGKCAARVYGRLAEGVTSVFNRDVGEGFVRELTRMRDVRSTDAAPYFFDLFDLAVGFIGSMLGGWCAWWAVIHAAKRQTGAAPGSCSCASTRNGIGGVAQQAAQWRDGTSRSGEAGAR
jgi:hypothetical protein